MEEQPLTHRANLETDPGTALAWQTSEELLTQGCFLQGTAQKRDLSCSIPLVCGEHAVDILKKPKSNGRTGSGAL